MKLRASNQVLFLLAITLIICSLLLPRAFSWQDFIKRFLFSFSIVGMLHIAINYALEMLRTQNSCTIQAKCALKHSKLFFVSALCICLFLANVVVYIRYIPSFNPKGFDTPYYVYTLRSFYFGKFEFELFFHPLVIFLFMPLSYLFNGDPFLIGISLPFMSASVFTILVFVSIYEVSKSTNRSLTVTAFSILNFFFVRLTYDLYSQTLFIGFLCLTFAMLKSTLGTCESAYSLKRWIMIGTLLVALFLIDPTSSFIAYVFFIIVFLLKPPKLTTKTETITLKKILIVVALLLFCIIAIMFSLGLFQNFLRLYTRILESELSIFKPQPNWDWIVYVETMPVLFLFAVSIAYFMARKNHSDEFTMLLILWSSYILGVIFITGYIQSYRLLLFIPLSIIMGNGIYSILNEPIFWISLPKLKVVKLKYILGLALILIVGVEIVPKAYIADYEYYPKDITSVLSDMAFVGGFGSSDVLYVVYKWPNVSIYWYNVYLGKNVFIGDVMQLLESNISTSKILSHQKMYPLKGLTRLVADPLDKQVFLINTSYLRLPVMELFQRWTTQITVSYIEHPINISNFAMFGNLNISKNDDITITFQDTYKKTLIGGLTRRLQENITADEIFLIYNGNITSTLTIELYRSKSMVQSIKMYAIKSNEIFSLVNLADTIVFDEYRILITGNGNGTLQTLTLNLISFGTSN